MRSGRIFISFVRWSPLLEDHQQCLCIVSPIAVRSQEHCVLTSQGCLGLISVVVSGRNATPIVHIQWQKPYSGGSVSSSIQIVTCVCAVSCIYSHFLITVPRTDNTNRKLIAVTFCYCPHPVRKITKIRITRPVVIILHSTVSFANSTAFSATCIIYCDG